MKIQLKRSNVLTAGFAKEPTASQLEYGELAINYNTDDPAIFLKDSNNNIIRISGVGNIADDGQVELPASTTPPSNPVSGNLWYNSDDGRLYIYYADADTEQWVDASPDSWDPTVLPDTGDNTSQSGTLDDRYLMLNSANDPITGGLKITGGNVGIGTNSPQDKLQIQDGRISIASTTTENSDVVLGTLMFRNGSSNNKNAKINAYLEGGSSGAGLRFYTRKQADGTNDDGGLERMRIDSNGKVGIGTSSPASILHTVGTRDYTGTTPSTTSYDNNFQSGTAYVAIGQSNGCPSIQGHGTGTAYNLALAPNNGNVGIGTSTPNAELDILGDANDSILPNNAIFKFKTVGGNGLYMGTRSSSPYQSYIQSAFQENNNNNNPYPLLLNPEGGNVGIGTSNPTRNLVVNKSSGNVFISVRSPDTGIAGLLLGDQTSDHRGQIAYSNSADSMQFLTASSERMRIDGSGHMLIHQLSTATPGTNNSTTGASFENTTSGTSLFVSRSTSVPMYLNRNNTGGILSFRLSGAQKGQVVVNSSSVSYSTTSDYRLKENVVVLDNAIDRVKQLLPKRFNFIDDAQTLDGFLAHEAQTVVPEAVTGTHNEVDDEGNPVMQGIDQSKLVPLLTAALQESIGRIETLEAEVAALKAQ